jgi:Tfp pilus assembly protein PilV
MRTRLDERGMTLVEVLVAASILMIGVVGVANAFSVAYTDLVTGGGQSQATAFARQELEVLKNQPFSTTASGTDNPTPEFTRTWNTVLVAGTVAPNQVVTITVTVTWRTGWSRSQSITLQTNRMQWG